jgi:AcrR family transcriptional regulator
MRTGHKTRAEQVEDNRGAVLAAARRVFLARGYSGATLDAIAEEAGFSKGVVYSQFGGKADLFLALLNLRIDERAAQNERAVRRQEGIEAVFGLLRNFERDARAEAGWAELLLEFRTVALRDPALNQRYAEAHDRTLSALADLLDRLHVQSDVDPAVDPRTMAEFILAIGSGMALERAASPRSLPAAALTEMVTRALGLGADGAVLATHDRVVSR